MGRKAIGEASPFKDLIVKPPTPSQPQRDREARAVTSAAPKHGERKVGIHRSNSFDGVAPPNTSYVKPAPVKPQLSTTERLKPVLEREHRQQRIKYTEAVKKALGPKLQKMLWKALIVSGFVLAMAADSRAHPGTYRAIVDDYIAAFGLTFLMLHMSNPDD
jgi:hypothetical protein